MKKITLSNCPLIVANSADINDDIRSECRKVNFDKIFCQLGFRDIEQVLMPEMLSRSKAFQEIIDKEIENV